MQVYKIFRIDEWRALQRSGQFEGSHDDRASGFIHLSTAEQLTRTAQRHFAGQGPLVLAQIAAQTLPELVWEARSSGRYPHLYRALRIDDIATHSPYEVPCP